MYGVILFDKYHIISELKYFLITFIGISRNFATCIMHNPRLKSVRMVRRAIHTYYLLYLPHYFVN